MKCVVVDVKLFGVIIDFTMCCRWSRSEFSNVVAWFGGHVSKYEVFLEGWCSRSFNMCRK